ncbi:MAG: hypothetical protein A2431_01950 [Candidatus Zambryskibacteria bacterium RIFOXYC1_FULL_39_10]|uniref:VanZ-like domain-containing protein n=1 Tax=Candidatus Zambryskibacteria bacterium RIFOXYC1_FULL_39_10 TaxID=1802779 RepID=A0A1G2V476_9BACT|nr:MAG: hypothetical protein A2605_02780 [Candidatus Zambryskibacteria bacterium RIFOXYD1_FULL_39_35]OHB16439.1 MAG: hypothetical protein A2431_01950 [Candidatus Zambryskibacteria bacterium RIFOXYC1_FULL_39_10]
MEFDSKKSIIKQPLFWETFVLLTTVGVLNYIANIYHLYWSVNEFDSLVHFLGGATLSAFFLWLYFYSGFFNPTNRKLKDFLLVSVLGAMFVAVSWEIYELFLGEAVMNKAEYPFDTMLDIIMDLLGILAICFYGYLKEHNAKY